jgi:hypothetical protein
MTILGAEAKERQQAAKVARTLICLMVVLTVGTGCRHPRLGDGAKEEYRLQVFRCLLELATPQTAAEQELAAEQLAIVSKNMRPPGFVGVRPQVMPLNRDRMPTSWHGLIEVEDVAYAVIYDPVLVGEQPEFRGFEIQIHSKRAALILRAIGRIGTYSRETSLGPGQ